MLGKKNKKIKKKKKKKVSFTAHDRHPFFSRRRLIQNKTQLNGRGKQQSKRKCVKLLLKREKL